MPETTATEKQTALLLEVSTLIVNAVNLHHIDPKTLNATTSLRETGLELDSVDILEVIVAIEQRYGVKVADAEMGNKYFRNLGGIVELVQNHRTVPSS